MEIMIRKLNPYCDVTIEEGSTRLGLGLLDKEEQEKLRQNFLEAAEYLKNEDD
jgi:hypothetical protein